MKDPNYHTNQAYDRMQELHCLAGQKENPEVALEESMPISLGNNLGVECNKNSLTDKGPCNEDLQKNVRKS
eukprot:2846728-Amphidinium_carterae.1